MNRKSLTKTGFETIPVEAIPSTVMKDSKSRKKAPRHESLLKWSQKPSPVRILVVDDDESIAASLARLLQVNGYQSFAANNSQDAIAAAESFTPDVVLSDVMMPGINGVDTCVRIKNKLPACRILMLSGEVSVADSLMQDARRSGYNFDLLSKPLEPRALIARINTLFTGPHSAVIEARA